MRALVNDSPGGVWRGLSSDIKKQMGTVGDAYTSQEIKKEIPKFKNHLLEYDGIIYKSSNSSGGCRHCFAVVSTQANEFAVAPFTDTDADDEADATTQPAE